MNTSQVFLGLLGSFLLAVSGIPQLIRIIRVKKVTGLSPYSLSCVCVGCICMDIFVTSVQGISLLNVSYTFNAVVSLTNLILYLVYKKQ